MQLSTWLGHIVRSGEVTLFTDGLEALQIKAGNNKIDLGITNNRFLKDIITSAGGETSIRRKLAQIKEIAGELKNEGLTVTITYKGDRLITLGLEANPRFSRLVTGTEAVEINNLRKLLELGV